MSNSQGPSEGMFQIWTVYWNERAREMIKSCQILLNHILMILDVYFGFVWFEWLWSRCPKSHVAGWFVRTTLLWQCWLQAGFVHWMFHGTNENALEDWKSCCCLSILKLQERPIWQNHLAVWRTQTEKHNLFGHGGNMWNAAQVHRIPIAQAPNTKVMRRNGFFLTCGELCGEVKLEKHHKHVFHFFDMLLTLDRL